MIRILLALTIVGACIPIGMQQAREDRMNQLCSDPRAAYEHGYNAGMSRQPLNTYWIDQYCAPEARETQRQAYTTGFQTGLQYAPAYPQPGYAQPGYAQAPAQECPLDSDGGHSCGYNCRLGSDGHHDCASSPAGQCALNSDGSWSCP